MPNIQGEIELRLKELEKKYQALFENSPFNIGILNASGKILNVNSENDQLGGYSKEELIGKNFVELQLLPKKYIPLVSHSFENLVKKGASSPIEIQLQNKKGDLIWYYMQASIIELENEVLYLVFSQDIEEKKRIVQRLKESKEQFTTERIFYSKNLENSENKFKKLVDISPDCIYLTSLAGTIVECNRAAEHTLNMKKEKIVGRNINNIYKNIELKKFYVKQVIQSIECEKYIDFIEYKMPDNSLWFNAYLILFSLPNMKIPQVLVNLHDISGTVKNNKNNVEFLLTFNHEIANRLESYDIGLNSIEKLFHYCSKKKKISKILGNKLTQAISTLHHLKAENELLNNTARKFISLKKLESNIKFEYVKISDVIQKVKNSLVKKYDRYRVSFRVLNKIPKNFKFYSNEIIMETIFRNLLDNSIKYRVLGTIPRIIINYDIIENDNLLLIKVQDNGIGFIEDELSRLFKQFSQIRPTENEKGFHIGLCNIKNLIEKSLKGSIKVISSGRNKGSTFIITLPFSLSRIKKISNLSFLNSKMLKTNYSINSILRIFHGFLYNYDLFIVSKDKDLRDNLYMIEDIFPFSKACLTLLNYKEYDKIKRQLNFQDEIIVFLDSDTIKFIPYRIKYKDLAFERQLYNLINFQKPLYENIESLRSFYADLYCVFEDISEEYDKLAESDTSAGQDLKSKTTARKHLFSPQFKKIQAQKLRLQSMVKLPIKDNFIDLFIVRNFGEIPPDIAVSYLVSE